MKGELDDAVAKLGFEKLTILRPASLVGKRKVKRLAEIITIPAASFLTKFILNKYRPITGKTVATAMINAAVISTSEKTIWEGKEVFSLAGGK